MPAHNEEAALATVFPAALAPLAPWVKYLEVIVVNDAGAGKCWLA